MAKLSAGIVLFRQRVGRLEVLLAHPGGPFWANKDEGAWSIPKGEYAEDEDPLTVARREFAEELGHPLVAPDDELLDLGEVRQRSGKRVRAWAAPGDLDPEAIESNSFEIEWPPRSGKTRKFPEVDRAAWFEPAPARQKILPAQTPFLDRLAALVESG